MDIVHSFKKFLKSRSMTLIYVTVTVILFFYFMNNSYLSKNNLMGMMSSISFTGIMAIGVSFLLMGGEINLASGAQGCFGAVIVAVIMLKGVPWPLALLFGLLFGVVAGLINSFFVNKLGFVSFISTLGMSFIYNGLAVFFAGNNNVPIANQFFWQIGSYLVFGVIPMPFIIMVFFMLVYSFVLNKTSFGRSILMCGGNSAAARLAGISPKKVVTILYINSGIFAVLSGSVLAARMHNASPTALGSSTLDAITASVLGGVSFGGGGGSMSGLFIGVILLTAFNNGLVAVDLYSYWRLVIQGALLIVALIFDFLSIQARAASMKKANMQNAA